MAIYEYEDNREVMKEPTTITWADRLKWALYDIPLYIGILILYDICFHHGNIEWERILALGLFGK